MYFKLIFGVVVFFNQVMKKALYAGEIKISKSSNNTKLLKLLPQTALNYNEIYWKSQNREIKWQRKKLASQNREIKWQ